MHNCLGNRIAEALLGFNYYYVAQVAMTGVRVPVAIELAPLSSGQWKIEGIYGPKNRPVPVSHRKALVAKLVRMGAVFETNPSLHPEAHTLVDALHVHRWNDLVPLEENSNEPLNEMMDIVIREIDRAIGPT